MLEAIIILLVFAVICLGDLIGWIRNRKNPNRRKPRLDTSRRFGP